MAVQLSNVQEPAASHGGLSRHDALNRLREHLHNPRFWAVQGLVVLATTVHWGFEIFQNTTNVEIEGLFIVVMYAVYFVPVIYASLNFGREGAIPTAIWAAVLGIPSILLWHTGVDRVVEGVQHLTIIGLAVVIAGRVDREVSARRQAERESRARRLSEARYRSLFDAVGDAILVFDHAGVIREANARAAERFARSAGDLVGSSLDRVLGTQNADRLVLAMASDDGDDDLLVMEDSGPVLMEPICSRVRTNGGPELIQAVLRDVTADRQRRQGLELYARQVIQAQEEERRRIARELHDSPLQSLILLHRELDALETARADLPGDHHECLAAVRQQAVAIADELRRFSRDLRPSILDDLGLVPAVRWLATDLSSRTGIQADFEVVGPPTRLSSDLELGLFRIAQEALRNVERHAQATRVSVTLAYEGDQIRLMVQDDGVGLVHANEPIVTASAAGKLGLLGMKERARLLGGLVMVRSLKDRSGTQVEAELPLLLDQGDNSLA